MVNPMTLAEMSSVRQALSVACVKDIAKAIESEISKLRLHHEITPGDSVAVAVGSRGISRIDDVVGHCISILKDIGLRPFIVPAMGSHGGATASGQKAVLEKLGITEVAMGVPIASEMDVVCLDVVLEGLPLFFAKKALEADHIVILNRIKPHTKFKAEIESGLCKMLTIGLGKAEGAAEFHQWAIEHTFKIIETAAAAILGKSNVLFGLALLENGRGELAHLEAVLPMSFVDREKVLLKEAYNMMGRIPFDMLDILIVDRIGKDISGIGMDSNVTGRHRDIVGDFHTAPHAKRIFVRDLSPASDGNANGIGLADFTTRRLVDSMDLKKTYVNAMTAISPEKAAIPIYFDSDREALEACVKTVGFNTMESARIVRIRDTGNLELMQVSRALEKDVMSNPNLDLVTPWRPIRFDDYGNLYDFSTEIRS
jgi:Lactate racemase N-terminal domain